MKMWSCCCDDISLWAAVSIQLLQQEPHVRPPLCSRHPLTRWLLSIAILQTSACGCGVHFSCRPFPANVVLIIFNKVWTVRLRERVELSAHHIVLAALSSDFKQCFVLPSSAFSPHVHNTSVANIPARHALVVLFVWDVRTSHPDAEHKGDCG